MITLWLRRVHLLLAVAFVASILLQVYFIGRFLFAGEPIDPHTGFGYLIPLFAFVLLISAFVARLPRGAIGWVVLLLVLTVVQTSLPALREQLPLVAALHPVNALVLFLLSVYIAQRAQRESRVVARA